MNKKEPSAEVAQYIWKRLNWVIGMPPGAKITAIKVIQEALEERLLSTPATSVDGEAERGVPCSDCGIPLNDGEAQTFTVCDACWEKAYSGKKDAVEATTHVRQKELSEIGERLRAQDNRCTSNPMFCVQIKRRDAGYDSSYCDRRCWHDSANEQTVYDDDIDFKEPPTGKEWDEFGYCDRWETVMAAFTEGGCEEYLRLNGHNDKSRSHNGEVRIYVESWNRCPEMIAIREMLMALPSIPDTNAVLPPTGVTEEKNL